MAKVKNPKMNTQVGAMGTPTPRSKDSRVLTTRETKGNKKKK